MSDIRERLIDRFSDEDYRYAYDEEFANSRMAMQIQVIREKQELKQVELAELSEMRQSRISELENVNYSMWTVSTLRRLAKALGVRFSFGFESWGELLEKVEKSGREDLERPRFEDDPAFQKEQASTNVLTSDKFPKEPPPPITAHNQGTLFLMEVSATRNRPTKPQTPKGSQITETTEKEEYETQNAKNAA